MENSTLTIISSRTTEYADLFIQNRNGEFHMVNGTWHAQGLAAAEVILIALDDFGQINYNPGNNNVFINDAVNFLREQDLIYINPFGQIELN